MGSIVRSSIYLLTADESMSSLLVRSGFYHHSMGVYQITNSFSPKARELEASSYLVHYLVSYACYLGYW